MKEEQLGTSRSKGKVGGEFLDFHLYIYIYNPRLGLIPGL